MMNRLHPFKLSTLLIVGTVLSSARTSAQASGEPTTTPGIDADREGWSTPAPPIGGEAKDAEYSFLINGGSISTFPIPAIGRLNVIYTPAKDGGLVLQLLDTHAHIVAPVINAHVIAGEARQFYFEVGGLANGTYVVRAQHDAVTLVRRVLVAH